MPKYKIYKPEGVPDPYGTYVHGLEPERGSRLVFIAGQVPVAADGSVPKTMTEQATICWGHVEGVLKDAGLDMSHLVKTTMYLTDRELYAEADAVSAEFLKNHRTPAVCVEVSSLMEPDWLIEVEGIAAAP
ncbi:RidA family protein [uncultured Ruegeria sp.]|uniref:RidA family protein n=1 Tax=uncultured Ruegeria sp. TaxID=259304 RepID=UPI0026047E97|nr:RidA family protein [uncultured Ruegeria sp.]